jgi:hypothetical protein
MRERERERERESENLAAASFYCNFKKINHTQDSKNCMCVGQSY